MSKRDSKKSNEIMKVLVISYGLRREKAWREEREREGKRERGRTRERERETEKERHLVRGGEKERQRQREWEREKEKRKKETVKEKQWIKYFKCRQETDSTAELTKTIDSSIAITRMILLSTWYQ